MRWKVKYLNYMMVAIMAWAANCSLADNYTWTGSADGNWINVANWLGGTVPTTTANGLGGDDVITIQNGIDPTVNMPTFAAKTEPTFLLHSYWRMELLFRLPER